MPEWNLQNPRYCPNVFSDRKLEGGKKYNSDYLSNYTLLDEALKNDYFVDFYNRANMVLDSQKVFHIGNRPCSKSNSCPCLTGQKQLCSFSAVALQPRGNIFQVSAAVGVERVYDIMIEVITPENRDNAMLVYRGQSKYPDLMSAEKGIRKEFLKGLIKPADVLADRVVDDLGESQSRLICNSNSGMYLVNRLNTKDWWCAEANARGDFRTDIVGDLQADTPYSLISGYGFDISEAPVITSPIQNSFWFEAKPSRIVRLANDDIHFPTVRGNMLWKADVGGIFTKDRSPNEHIKMSVSATLPTWTFPSKIPMVCPEVTFKSLTGCYNCQLGAILRLEVKSSCESGLAWLESSVLTTKAVGLVKWLDGGKVLPQDDGKLRLAFYATQDVQTVEFIVFYDEPTMMDIFYIYPKIKGLSEPRSVIVQAALSVPTDDISIPDPSLIGLNESEIENVQKQREDVYYIVETRVNSTMGMVKDNAALALQYRKIILTIAIVILSMAIMYVLTSRPKRDTVAFKIWMSMMTQDEFNKLTADEQKNYIEYHSSKQKK
jgi:hypothetical protein